MRASDADREAYVEVLQRAYLDGRLTKVEYDERMGSAYQAVTYADLVPLLHDLPVAPGQVPGPPVRPQPAPVVGPASDGAPTSSSNAAIMALFSEVSRDSRWTVTDGQLAVAVFGAVKLDLRTALLQSATTEFKANAIFGSVEITVPGDIDVQVDGVGAFGEYKRVDARTVMTQDLDRPVVRITGLALFGSVQVTIVDAPVTGRDRLAGPSGGPALGS